MKIIIVLSLFCFILNAGDYENGVHIKNKDDKVYKISFFHNSMTTKICNIKKPTKKIKNGIVAIADRKDKNFKVISKKNEIVGEISKKSTVNCICVRSCEVKVDGIGKKSLKSGQVLIIEKGKLKAK